MKLLTTMKTLTIALAASVTAAQAADVTLKYLGRLQGEYLFHRGVVCSFDALHVRTIGAYVFGRSVVSLLG